MNFYSIRTNDQKTIGQILNGIVNIDFDRLSWHKDEISIGDIVFIVISGDSSKKEHTYDNGLRAIGKVVNLPKDEEGEKHFNLEVDIIEFLPRTLTKDDFYVFPTLKDAPNIGPDTRSAPNQAFRKIDIEIGKSVIRAIADLLDDSFDRTKYKDIVGNNYEIKKLRLEINDETPTNKVSKEKDGASYIQDKFVEWFHKPENFKKSYEGLVTHKVLNFWNESYFESNLFSIDYKELLNSLLSIERLIADKSKLEWKSYSEASSKGAPEAVLGKNNYLKFLTEFVNDETNIKSLRDFSHSNTEKLVLKDIDFNLKSFYEKIDLAGLIFPPQLIQRFVASLCTKPFVICSGLSGSGKTKLAQAFVQWITESDKQYKIIPVGADWTNREPLLGYPNGLDPKSYVTPDSGALQLILEASKVENQSRPYFMILDEMNLSHVERYFADFLSIMESEEKLKLYSGEKRYTKYEEGKEPDETYFIPHEIKWPNNLFIIGTVNIDETTYMFSPKVLDRANVIEFRITPSEMGGFFENRKELNMKKLFLNEDKSKGGAGQSMGEHFFKLAEEKTIFKIPEIDGKDNVLNKFFTELQLVGSEFGYRSASEIELLITKLSIDGFIDEDGNSIENNTKIDIAIMQKLLPKLHGSRKKLVDPLETLAGFCLERIIESQPDEQNKTKNLYQQFISEKRDIVKWNIIYPISLEKIERMRKNVIENGFTSYAEA